MSAGPQILLANPRGFCAGVDRAIEIVSRALASFGAPIYVRHEVVHNKTVVEDLRNRGAVFVDDLDEVPDPAPGHASDHAPDPAIVIFSAHGVSRAVREQARRRGFRVFDATCPLVTKVHMEVLRFSRRGQECVLIGHVGHPEVEGSMGQYDFSCGGAIHLVENVDDVARLQIRDPHRLAYVTQTTLSVEDTAEIIAVLRKRFPEIRGPRRDDICYATQNRQDAVKQLALEAELVLVVGSENSSNSNRLRELATRMGARSHLIDRAGEIRRQWLDGVQAVGVSAGASAPETLVQEVVERLCRLGCSRPSERPGIPESLIFSLPRELRDSPSLP